ncbi:MAG: lasso RiPP family leader peptide-containing protein [Polyangiaceae bacterium]
MSEKELYEAPELTEIGDMTELTQEYGFGLAELFASIISGGPITVGKCNGSCFS